MGKRTRLPVVYAGSKDTGNKVPLPMPLINDKKGNPIGLPFKLVRITQFHPR
jgi:hypothetical protein